MDKLVYAGGALIAVALILGSVLIPGSFVMTIASTSLAMNIGRVVIVVLMIALIATNPPRRKAFRTVLAMASLGLLYMAYQRAMSGTIQLADSVLYLQAAIAFGIEALESGVQRRLAVSDEVDIAELKRRRKQPSLAV